jgi:hypothetical protein
VTLSKRSAGQRLAVLLTSSSSTGRGHGVIPRRGTVLPCRSCLRIPCGSACHVRAAAAPSVDGASSTGHARPCDRCYDRRRMAPRGRPAGRVLLDRRLRIVPHLQIPLFSSSDRRGGRKRLGLVSFASIRRHCRRYACMMPKSDLPHVQQPHDERVVITRRPLRRMLAKLAGAVRL